MPLPPVARFGRPLWIALGCASLALAAVGAVLPVMPTTCFVLLAAWCFARSSPRLHAWLRSSRGFGPVICEWEANRSMPRNAKVIAIAMIVTSFSLSIGAVYPRGWLVGLLLGLGAALVGLILSIRTSAPRLVGEGRPAPLR